MRKTICGLFGAALLLTAITASSATLSGSNRNTEYGIDHFSPWSGTATNTITSPSTNLIGTADLTKHDKFTLIFSAVTATNQLQTNLVTLELYDLLSDSTTAVPGLRPAQNPKWTATLTCIGALNSKVTNTIITNITVDCIGYQVLYAKVTNQVNSAALTFTNVYFGRALKPQRDGSN